MKIFLECRSNGKVVSYSDNPNGNLIEYEITDEEKKMIKKGYELYFDGKINFIKTKKIEHDEAKDELLKKIINKSVTLEDVSQLILKLL